MQQILIANGRPTLLISLADLGTRIDPLTTTRTSNGNLLFGITTRPFVLEQQTASNYIGVQLRPYGLTALLPSELGEDIDASLEKVQAAGGGLVNEKSFLPCNGYVVYIKDTEGNTFGLI